MNEFYDVVDPEGNVVETAEQAKAQVDEGQAALTPAPKLSEGDLKRLRKMYITKNHPRVVACGHVLDLSRQPRHRNCEHCWFAFFNQHGEVVQQLDEMHTLGKDNEIIELQGIKFYHRWRQFMATVAQWKEANETVETGNSSPPIVG
jgi:hypothetical protein